MGPSPGPRNWSREEDQMPAISRILTLEEWYPPVLRMPGQPPEIPRPAPPEVPDRPKVAPPQPQIPPEEPVISPPPGEVPHPTPPEVPDQPNDGVR
jgi:hypothetical protein